MAIVSTSTTKDTLNALERREYMKKVRQHPEIAARAYREAKESFENCATMTPFLTHVANVLTQELELNAEITNTEEFRGSLYAFLFAVSIDKEKNRPKGLIPMIASYTLEKEIPQTEEERKAKAPKRKASDIMRLEQKLEMDKKILKNAAAAGTPENKKLMERVNRLHAEQGGRTGEVRAKMFLSAEGAKIKPRAEQISRLNNLIAVAGVANGQWYKPDRDAREGDITITDKMLDDNLGSVEFSLSDLA